MECGGWKDAPKQMVPEVPDFTEFGNASFCSTDASPKFAVNGFRDYGNSSFSSPKDNQKISVDRIQDSGNLSFFSPDEKRKFSFNGLPDTGNSSFSSPGDSRNSSINSFKGSGYSSFSSSEANQNFPDYKLKDPGNPSFCSPQDKQKMSVIELKASGSPSFSAPEDNKNSSINRSKESGYSAFSSPEANQNFPGYKLKDLVNPPFFSPEVNQKFLEKSSKDSRNSLFCSPEDKQKISAIELKEFRNRSLSVPEDNKNFSVNRFQDSRYSSIFSPEVDKNFSGYRLKSPGSPSVFFPEVNQKFLEQSSKDSGNSSFCSTDDKKKISAIELKEFGNRSLSAPEDNKNSSVNRLKDYRYSSTSSTEVDQNFPDYSLKNIGNPSVFSPEVTQKFLEKSCFKDSGNTRFSTPETRQKLSVNRSKDCRNSIFFSLEDNQRNSVNQKQWNTRVYNYKTASPLTDKAVKIHESSPSSSVHFVSNEYSPKLIARQMKSSDKAAKFKHAQDFTNEHNDKQLIQRLESFNKITTNENCSDDDSEIIQICFSIIRCFLNDELKRISQSVSKYYSLGISEIIYQSTADNEFKKLEHSTIVKSNDQKDLTTVQNNFPSVTMNDIRPLMVANCDKLKPFGSLRTVKFIKAIISGVPSYTGLHMRTHFVVRLPTATNKFITGFPELKGTLVHPDFQKSALCISANDDGTYDASFSSNKIGLHMINLTYGNYKVGRSTLVVRVCSLNDQIPRFNALKSVQIEPSSYIYCDKNGYLLTIGFNRQSISLYNSCLQKKWQIQSPKIFAVSAVVDYGRRICYTDSVNKCVNVLRFDGTLRKNLTSKVSNIPFSEYLIPTQITSNERSHIAVTDMRTNRLLIFNQEGSCMRAHEIFRNQKCLVTGIAYALDSRFLYAMNDDNLFKLDTLGHYRTKVVRRFSANEVGVRKIKNRLLGSDKIFTTPQNFLIVFSFQKQTVECYDGETLQFINLKRIERPLTCIAMSPNGTLYGTSLDGHILEAKFNMFGSPHDKFIDKMSISDC